MGWIVQVARRSVRYRRLKVPSVGCSRSLGPGWLDLAGPETEAEAAGAEEEAGGVATMCGASSRKKGITELELSKV